MQNLTKSFDGRLEIDSAYGEITLHTTRRGHREKVLGSLYLDNLNEIIQELTIILNNVGYYDEN